MNTNEKIFYNDGMQNRHTTTNIDMYIKLTAEK